MLYVLNPVKLFVPVNETEPPVETALSTYSLVHKTLLAFISANTALHITFFVNVLFPRDKKLPDKSTDAGVTTCVPELFVKSFTIKFPYMVDDFHALNVAIIYILLEKSITKLP